MDNTKGTAAILCRLSGEKWSAESTERNLRSQIDACKAWCLLNGYDVIDIYSEVISATKKNANREEFKRLVTDAEMGNFEIIVTWEGARLFRKYEDRRSLEDLRHIHNVHCVFLDDGIDTRTEDGQIKFAFIAEMNQQEAEKIASRQKRLYEWLQENGLPRRGEMLPYGLEWDLDHLDIGRILLKSQAHKKVVQDITKRYLGGESIRSIVQYLNASSIVDRSGTAWSESNLRRMLNNPLIAGGQLHNGEVIINQSGEALVPAMITAEDFKRMKAKRKKNGNNWLAMIQQAKSIRYIPSNFYQCSCGKPMKLKHKQKKKTDDRYKKMVMRCTDSSNKSVKHATIFVWIAELVVDKQLFLAVRDDYLSRINQIITNSNVARKQIEVQLIKEQNYLDDYLFNCVKARIPAELAVKGTELLTSNIESLKVKLEKYDAQNHVESALPEKFKKDPSLLEKAWPFMTMQEKTTMLGIYCHRVVIHPVADHADRSLESKADRVEIIWNFDTE